MSDRINDNRAHRYEYNEKANLVDTTKSLSPIPEVPWKTALSLAAIGVVDAGIGLTAATHFEELTQTVEFIAELFVPVFPEARLVAGALTAGAMLLPPLLLVVMGRAMRATEDETARRDVEAGRTG